ncbi:MAG: DUF4175 domain-containing protein [Roseicyclus sp.]|nr:DUF4175 domain-containing protein [Roseicyclus sp.]MBO6623980.1 DUF4175 domain-containing protein [Roseicyclus sp.]MBO6923011.1 DUF4175 domain-containing protein [Roseicyclus sp.]
MTDQIPPTDAVLRRLAWPLRLTRAGMFAERAVRAFWPVWTILLLAIAVFAFGAADALPLEVLWVALVLILASLIWFTVKGLRGFRLPTREAALDRLDRTLPGRPITALIDTPAVGGGDPASRAVWEAHVERMAIRAATARAPEPDLRISDRDPYGLRFIAATAFAMALVFGAIWRVGDVGDAVVGAGEASISGPSWEGWVEPPLYTGLPSLYLNDITREEFEAPAGSRITMRFYGELGALRLRQSVMAPPAGETNDTAAPAQDLILERSGEIAVEGTNGRSWQIVMLHDQPPAVVLDGEMTGIPPGQMQFTYTATDDYAVISGQARLMLNADAADRRFGLAVEPEPREALVLDLPMPFAGSRAEFSELLVEDLSQHPFANLPVTLTLTVVDDAGQIGTIRETIDRLPGRRFFDPLANAIIEQRRDILWSRENAPRAAQILRAISHRPDGAFDDDGAYLMVRTAIRRLEAAVDSISVETRDQVAEILWNAAIELEEGDLADALERLRRAQDRLAEAMRQGASDEEIAQLMDELRQAMDDYMQQLAENAQPGEDQPDGGETMEMSMADLNEMLRRIEELMQQGRMAEAQEMLDALRQMMENMQITQGEGGDGPQTPGEQAMQDLQDTLRDQQSLSDDSFQELQEQFNPGRPNPQQGPQGQQSQQGPGQPGQQGQPGQGGQNGEPGEQAQDGQGGPQSGQPGQQPGTEQGEGRGGEGDGRSLAQRQEDLRRQLQEQALDLPGEGTEGGEAARQALDDAERAMDEAAEALGRGDLADALDSQSEAMEALREGMGELGRALAQESGTEEPGQGQADGTAPPDRPLQDPLGRQAGNAGAFGSEEGFEQREEAFRRARELLDEIRRRSAEQDRPEVELEYLRRLLDQF